MEIILLVLASLFMMPSIKASDIRKSKPVHLCCKKCDHKKSGCCGGCLSVVIIGVSVLVYEYLRT